MVGKNVLFAEPPPPQAAYVVYGRSLKAFDLASSKMFLAMRKTDQQTLTKVLKCLQLSVHYH